MRLKAKAGISYYGQIFEPGQLFDALERDGRDLINRDLAEPFGLEDPSQRSLSDVVEQFLPDVPGVSITPQGVIVPPVGGTGSITVSITSPGVSGTWTVDKDSAATWLTYTPMTPQSESGTVDWTAESNPDTDDRVANLYINGKTFKVDQNGVPAFRPQE